jgi:Fructose-1-6-bisphosphatase, N-terminal domain
MMTKFSVILFGALCAASATAFLPQKTYPGIRQHYYHRDVSLLQYANGEVEPAGTPTEEKSSTGKRRRTDPSTFRKPVHKNVCAQTGVTLSRYMMEMERLNPELEEVESIFTSIQVGCKAISKLVRTSSLASNTGAVGSINVQGEEQKKMDVLANDVLKNALQWAGHFKTIASEEEEEPLVGFMHDDGRPEALVDDKNCYIAVSCNEAVGMSWFISFSVILTIHP